MARGVIGGQGEIMALLRVVFVTTKDENKCIKLVLYDKASSDRGTEVACYIVSD